MTPPNSPRSRIDLSEVEAYPRIREELAHLLSTPQFTSSRRYPALLKWVVDKTLSGNAGELKERTVGVELFGKKPDYDTANDTIVRFTAGEVRRRLKIAYLDPSRSSDIRIELPLGGYIPEFYRYGMESSASDPVTERFAPPEVIPAVPLIEPTSVRIEKKWAMGKQRAWMVALPLLVLLAAGLAMMMFAHRRSMLADSATTRFWQPLEDSGSSVIIAPGAVVPSKTSEYGITPATKDDHYPYLSLATASAVTRVGVLLGQQRTLYSVQPSPAITLNEMLQHPVVLVGTYNNSWTLQFLNGLRFRVTSKESPGIVDTQDPNRSWHPTWIVKDGTRQRTDDYAIVARYKDNLTQNTVVLLAGLEKNGTDAAAEFVTNSSYLHLLDEAHLGEWTSENIEIVIRANVVDKQTGAPEIVASYSW